MVRAGSVVHGYDETPVVRHMQGREIGIAVDLGLGNGKARVFTLRSHATSTSTAATRANFDKAGSRSRLPDSTR
jgi:hypothetical protein